MPHNAREGLFFFVSLGKRAVTGGAGRCRSFPRCGGPGGLPPVQPGVSRVPQGRGVGTCSGAPKAPPGEARRRRGGGAPGGVQGGAGFFRRLFHIPRARARPPARARACVTLVRPVLRLGAHPGRNIYITGGLGGRVRGFSTGYPQKKTEVGPARSRSQGRGRQNARRIDRRTTLLDGTGGAVAVSTGRTGVQSTGVLGASPPCLVE